MKPFSKQKPTPNTTNPTTKQPIQQQQSTFIS